MPKYRKRPVEAEVYRPGLEDGFEYGRPYVQRLEGRQFVSPGDYIVTNAKGERRVVKPDDFAAEYEPVDAKEVGSSARSAKGS